MNRRGGNWKIFCTWVPHVNNFSPVCMLAKAVYHDKWIKENLGPRAVRQLSKWLSADCSISVDIYQRVSLLLRMSGLQWWQGREWDWLPVWMCWAVSKAERSILPLPPAVSLFHEELTTSSFQFNSFLSPMKNTGEENSRSFFSVCSFLLSSVHACMHARVCVGNCKRNWNVKNAKKLLKSLQSGEGNYSLPILKLSMLVTQQHTMATCPCVNL